MNRRPCRLIVIGAVWLLLVSGCWYFMLARPGIGISWEQESSPPEPVSLLKVEKYGEILAQTTSGDLYRFVYGSKPPWEKVEVSFENSEPDMNCDPSDSSGYLIPSPPGNVISRVSQNCVASETGYHLEVILLESGQVWLWKHASGGYFWVIVLGFAFLLGVPLLLLGLGGTVHQKIKGVES